jgi:dTDP-4-dehydrorhamnose 3,5-epimerase
MNGVEGVILRHPQMTDESNSVMMFTETRVKGAYLIEPQVLEDERGFFARTWCRHEFEAHGLNSKVAQCNISFNPKKGTLRGMHFQTKPCEETKLVRCTTGAIYDVVVDVRPESPSFRQHAGAMLTPQNRHMLYVPEGCAHGFMTLEDNTEVSYQISEFYAPDHARGYRWNDPAFGIEWPMEVQVISDRDRNYPDFKRPDFERPDFKR